MTPSRPWFSLVARLTLLFLITLVFTACPAVDPPEPEVQNPGIQTPSSDGDDGEIEIVGSTPAPGPDQEDYQVLLEADKKMKVGSKSYFRVWIGSEGYMPTPEEELIRDTTSVYAESDSYALVTPIAPDFEVIPNEAKRIPLKATGASAVFTLIPQKKGESFVSATVVIYDREGNEDPQSAQRLSVKVSSNFWGRQEVHANDMEKIFWDKFKGFFTALVVLVLGALLFVIRKYIKKKTGFDEKGNSEE